MTLREEVEQAIEDAKARIAKRKWPPGVMPAGDPDLRFVMIDEYFAAVFESLKLIADRIDASEQQTD
ncbi:hypothetical protein ACPPVW_17485 [Leifsonia sp. McL0607]|uniref:hypothetical protein n=1 Tax=Leifsonia sp. McL0607 TaxID=3415672 RepID=UPI003CE7D6F3